MNGKNELNELNGPTELVQQNVLLILKLDSQSLFNRIKTRKNEYLMEFSLKRTREHFKDIFSNKYEQVKVEELKYFRTELILALDQFYNRIEEMKWYLNHTQDMASMMQDKVDWYIRQLKKEFEELSSRIEMEFDYLNEMPLSTSEEPAELAIDAASEELPENVMHIVEEMPIDIPVEFNLETAIEAPIELPHEQDDDCIPPQFIDPIEKS